MGIDRGSSAPRVHRGQLFTHPGNARGEVTNNLLHRRYGVSRKSRRGRMAPHAPRTAAGLRSISARLKSRGCSLYRLIVNIFGFIQIKHFPCKN